MLVRQRVHRQDGLHRDVLLSGRLRQPGQEVLWPAGALRGAARPHLLGEGDDLGLAAQLSSFELLGQAMRSLVISGGSTAITGGHRVTTRG